MAVSIPVMKPVSARQFAKGVTWSGGSSMITSIIRLFIVAVLARVLVPKDFGLFAMTFIIIDFGNDIGDLGIGPAIIQRKDISQRQLSTLFWVTVIGGSVLFLLSLALSHLVGWFFHENLLVKLISIASISFVIRSLGFVQRALLIKELRFDKVAVVEIGSTIVFGVVSILMAFSKCGVWSLIGGTIAHRVADVVLTWSVAEFRPDCDFHIKESSFFFTFARNITGERICYLLSSRMDSIVIGRLLGPVALGFYNLAAEVPRLVPQKIAAIASSVAFPTLSRIQDDVEGLKIEYKRINKTLSVITFPLMAGLALITPEFVHIAFGSSWDQAILPMRVLCFVAAIKSVMQNSGPFFYIKSRPDIAFRWSIIQMVTIPIPLILGSHWGLVGIAVALAVANLGYFLVLQHIANRLLEMTFRTYLHAFIAPLLGSVCIVVVGLFTKASAASLTHLNPGLTIALVIVTSAMSFTLVMYLVDPSGSREFTTIVRHLVVRNASS